MNSESGFAVIIDWGRVGRRRERTTETAPGSMQESASTPLPWLLVNCIERCPKRKLTQPDRSDDAGRQAVAWIRLCNLRRDSSPLHDRQACASLVGKSPRHVDSVRRRMESDILPCITAYIHIWLAPLQMMALKLHGRPMDDPLTWPGSQHRLESSADNCA